MKRVLISGYYGFRNIGDEAVLQVLAAELSKAGAEPIVLSASPEETQSRYNVKAYNRLNPGQIFKAVNQSNVLLSGGGSLFQDATSSYSLYYYLGIVTLAMVLRKHVYIYSQGIGPIQRKLNRSMFAAVINRTRTISVRDQGSYSELQAMGVTKPAVTVTSDPVFLLQPASPERGANLLLEAGVDTGDAGPLIGMAVRSWGQGKDMAARFASVADKIIEDFGARLVFLPFHHPHDLDFTFDIVNRMKQKPYIVDNISLPSEMMSVMGLMHINIGVRLHALIFSACMGVPMIGISYDPKIDGFLKTMGIDPACRYEGLEWEKISKSITGINNDRASVLEKITKKVNKSRELAQNNLKDFLEELSL